MKQLLTILIVLVVAVLVAGLLPLFKDFPKVSVDDNVAQYFQGKMQEQALGIVGQPIEGFDASLLQDAFPGLYDEDFDSVETREGRYYFSSGELSYKRTQDSPVTSAERTITTEGYATLLSNLLDRFDISPADAFAADRTLMLISEGDLEKDFIKGFIYNDYIIRHPERWHPNIANPSVVLTSQRNPGGDFNDLSSLGTYISIRSDDEITGSSSIAVVNERDVVIGGVPFTRLVTQNDAGVHNGLVVYYIYEGRDESVSISHYPYNPASQATRDFEKLVQTFTPVQ